MIESVTCVLVFAAVVMAVVVVSMFLRDVRGAALMSCLGLRLEASFRNRKRKAVFDSKILDLTMGLANAMKAGMAFPQALEKVSEQLGGVMREEISVMLREYRLGMGLSDALGRLACRMPSEDMQLLVCSVKLTTQTGGSLVDVLTQMVETIRGRTEFQQKLRTLTAQGKFEALAMASAPMVAFVVLYLSQPDLMRPLVTTAVGWIAIAAVLVLEAIGFVIIRQIVTIEV